MPAHVSARPAVRLDGLLDERFGEALLELEIRLPSCGPARAELRCVDWDAEGGRAGARFDDVRLGAALEIEFGGETRATVFRGAVSAIECRYGDGAPQIVLLAEDAAARLMRARRSRVFARTSVADAVRRVAADAGLSTDVDVEGGGEADRHQFDETDLAFLARLLAPYGIEPRVDADGALVARPPEPRGSPIPLVVGAAVRRLRLCADLNRRRTRVEARGFDLANDAVAEAVADALRPEPPGLTAARALRDAGWDADAGFGPPFPTSQAEADAYSAAAFSVVARRFVTGDIVCEPEPRLAPGEAVALVGAGVRFSGDYVVSEAAHRFDLEHGAASWARLERAEWGP